MEKSELAQQGLTQEQCLNTAALRRFFEHFQLGEVGYRVREVYETTRSDGQCVIGWRRPEAYPGNVEFVAAGATIAEACDNAVAGLRLCATSMRLAMLDFECTRENGHEGECHQTSNNQADKQ